MKSKIYSVNDDFQDRFIELLEKLGYNSHGIKNNNFVLLKDRIIVRPYWWGDDDTIEAKLPNFECKEIGLEIKWYKYALRGAYSNIEFTEDIMKYLEKIVDEAYEQKKV